MSHLIENSITIYEALQNIKNGKYVMPAFQRQFVWTMGQIEKLWDSILLNYPIATFLFWHLDNSNVTEDTYFCSFLSDVTFNSRKLADSVNYELTNIHTNYTDTAILDGQQRLTSLFLSLFGEAGIRPNYARKKNGDRTRAELLIELNKFKINTDEEEYNSKKYDIRFTDKIGRISPTQFKVKDILNEKFQNNDTREKAIEDAIVNVPNDSKEYGKNILFQLYKKIYEDKLIRYTEIIDMKQEDALEMFVRFNSGGKPLKKSEITMSILEAYWPSAKTEFFKILVGPFEGFGTDFIIRTALMLYGDVVKSTISKGIAENLKNEWKEFKETLKELALLLSEMKIEVSRFSGSWNVLLPIIYFIYYNKDYEKNKHAIKSYLLRAIFFSYFQSGTTNKLQQMKSNINNYNFEITIEMLEQMNDLRVTPGKIDDIVSEEKGSKVVGEVLYYLSLDWINNNYKYEQDHLHPLNRFEKTKPLSISIEEWKSWRRMRNQLPNLHLLEGRSNGSKGDMRLVDFYNDMNEEQKGTFKKQAIIPDNVSLEFQDFQIFYDARKITLAEEIEKLLR